MSRSTLMKVVDRHSQSYGIYSLRTAPSKSRKKAHKGRSLQFFPFHSFAELGKKSTTPCKLGSCAYTNQTLLSASASCARLIVSMVKGISNPIVGSKNGSSAVRCLLPWSSSNAAPGQGIAETAEGIEISCGMCRCFDGLISPL